MTAKAKMKKNSPQSNSNPALELVQQMMAIPGASGNEFEIVEFIRNSLIKAGANPKHIRTDDANKRSHIGGEIGNLSFKLPGTKRKPRRLLMAHVDTVPLCVGCKPLLKGKYIQSANKQTGLGADDRAGAAVLLLTAMEILQSKLAHPPLTFFWPVQEEIGLVGSRNATLSLLGKPELAFNWDGGLPEKLTLGATGAYRMQIQIQGLASHAGGAPEMGISAIALAANAISKLHQEGWHGEILKNGKHGTSNVGVIQGGAATNVVTDSVVIRAEVRSHDSEFRKKILKAYQEAFRDAASSVKNAVGATGKVLIKHQLDYESFKLENDEPCVLLAEKVIQELGGDPIRTICNGGLDANWLTERGIPTVTLGCGQENQHTISERLNIASFEKACKIALRIATDLD